jgi:hypothetical protein
MGGQHARDTDRERQNRMSKLTLVCPTCSLKVRSLTAADIPATGVRCRCGVRLHAESLKKPAKRIHAHTPQHGPGTELKKLLAELGVTSFKDCGCNDKAAQMNRWGVEGCRANFDTIRDWLADAQASAGWATKITAAVKAAVSGLPINLSDIPGSLVRIAIERTS